KSDLYKTYPVTKETDDQLITKGRDLYFTSVITINGVQYLRTQPDTNSSALRGIPRSSLDEKAFQPMKTPRYMSIKNDLYKTNPATNEVDDQLLSQGRDLYFTSVVTLN